MTLPSPSTSVSPVEAISTSEIEKKVDDYHEFTLSVTLKDSDEEDV